jgi:hypothetical protein
MEQLLATSKKSKNAQVHTKTTANFHSKPTLLVSQDKHLVSGSLAITDYSKAHESHHKRSLLRVHHATTIHSPRSSSAALLNPKHPIT